LKLRGGYITGFAGDTVRIQDRFRQGAQSFRGFDIAGVGPRVLVPTVASGAAIFDAETLQPATPQQINNAIAALPNGGFDTGNSITFRSQSIGGNAYVVGSAEVLLPLPLPDSYGIRASIFTDFGAVGLVDDETRALNEQLGILLDVSPTRVNGDGTVERLDPDFLTLAAPIQDDFSFRLSAGVTIGWNSPFGPIRFDIAEVFIREFYDEVEAFRFSAGTNF
ncbi:MAG: BamA/TamA family outer membrane protein, partial [Pseudomonadota bacterium]